MPKDDYTAVAGGRLKLKGVSDGRVDKKKKKKKGKAKEKEKERDQSGSEAPTKTITETGLEIPEVKDKSEEPRSRSRSTSEAPRSNTGKTEAERRFEERKRRRLDERLMKEGVKSHKERVEEFNKYLANLSEHHDMCVILRFLGLCLGVLANRCMIRPRIGPG